MNKLKKLLKTLLPSSLLKGLLPTYHKLRAVLANAMYLFPARKLRVIGITGTNGKTSTATYLASILREAGYKVGVSTTAYFSTGKEELVNDTNMTVTNPFALQKLLFKMRMNRVDFVILEVTSHSLVQNRIWGVPLEAVGVTNLTQDHLDYHKTMENYAAAKAKIFEFDPKFVVLNRDDDWYDYFANAMNAAESVMIGQGDDADAHIGKLKLSDTGSKWQLKIDETTDLAMQTKLTGRFNVYNASMAAGLAYLLHIDINAIVRGVANLEIVPGRMEPVNAGQLFTVLIDYAHAADALRELLTAVRPITENRIILVFGATGDRDKSKRPIMGEVAAEHADRIVVTDDEPYTEDAGKIRKSIIEGIERVGGGSKFKEVAGRREAMQHAFSIARRGDTVIVTGMGHQKFMKIGGEKIAWNDREVAEELLQERAAKSAK